MKRIFALSILIVTILIFSTTITACKSNPDKYTSSITDTDIAKLSIFSFNGESESKLGLLNLGHAFLSIENISEENIELLNKTIKPNETITIGTWAVIEHFGVWYNIESNYILQHNKYDGRDSATIGINEKDIESIANFIAIKDKWNPLENCSHFALSLWNTVAESSEKINNPFIHTPSYISKELKKFDSYQYNKPIITETKMGYFVGEKYVSFEIEGGNYASV